MHVHMHACVYMHMMHMIVHLSLSLSLSIHTHMLHACIHIGMHICIHTCTHMRILYPCMYTCMYKHMHMFTLWAFLAQVLVAPYVAIKHFECEIWSTPIPLRSSCLCITGCSSITPEQSYGPRKSTKSEVCYIRTSLHVPFCRSAF